MAASRVLARAPAAAFPRAYRATARWVARVTGWDAGVVHRALASRLIVRFLQADGWPEDVLETPRDAPALPAAVERRVRERLLDAFPFALREGTPGAVTPEALGDASAWTVSRAARRRGGVYYTDRTLVHRMVRLALAHHAAGRLAWDERRTRELERCLAGVPHALAPRDAGAADAAIRDVRLCDPACGSGAFLVGALAGVADARARLARAAGERAPDAFTVRRRALDGILGLDVDVDAAWTARWRLRLALLADAPRGALPRLPDAAARVRVADALVDDVPRGFDVVIGNPPFVRHQALTDPRGGDARAYKRRLAAAFRARTGHAPPARADLLAHFIARARHLLAPGGVACLVAGSAWMDAAYGAPLRDLLTAEDTLILSLDPGQRAFRDADVNCAVTLFRRAPPPPGHAPAFVTLHADRGLREVRAPVAALRGADVPWGTLLHRADPEWARWALDVLQRVPPLAAQARVGAYATTRGADAFFYGEREAGTRDHVTVRFANGARFTLPRAFVHPVVRSPRTVRRLGLTGEDCARAVLVTLPTDAAALPATARAYVAWGEHHGFHRRANRRVERPWWKPPAATAAPVLVGCRFTRGFHALRNPRGLAAGRFHRVHPEGDADVLFALLNAAPVRFLAQVLGRAGLGDGVLDLGVSAVRRLPVPRVHGADAGALRDAARALMDADPRADTVCDARAHVDRLVAPHYGLDVERLPALERATRALVDARYARAARAAKGG